MVDQIELPSYTRYWLCNHGSKSLNWKYTKLNHISLTYDDDFKSLFLTLSSITLYKRLCNAKRPMLSTKCWNVGFKD
jgi:hypothetical protein